MAIGVNKNESIIGVAEESVEGVYEAPTKFLQPLEAFDVTSGRELLQREIVRSTIGLPDPRLGLKSAAATIPLEWKASGASLGGQEVESDLILQSLLGVRVRRENETTSETGNSTTEIQLTAVTVLTFTVGDIIVIKESGDFSVHFVTAIDLGGGSESITYLPSRGSSPADNVVISRSVTYSGAPSGTAQIPLSLSTFWGDEILEKTIGAKAASMSLDNFSVGQLASMNFTFQGTDFDREDGSASTPTFNAGIPPVILNACVVQDDTVLDLTEFSMTIANTVAQIRSTCATSGVLSQIFTERLITGSMNPYLDDTLVDQFDFFNNGQEYSIIATAFTPDPVTPGEILLGSVCGIFIPRVFTTATPIGDVDTVLANQVEFQASAGADGSAVDIFMGFV